jgi:hypothetical protein
MPKQNEARLRKGKQYDYESLDGKFVIHKFEYADMTCWQLGEADMNGACMDWYAQFKTLWEIRQYIYTQEQK